MVTNNTKPSNQTIVQIKIREVKARSNNKHQKELRLEVQFGVEFMAIMIERTLVKHLKSSPLADKSTKTESIFLKSYEDPL